MQQPRSHGIDWKLGDGEERHRESPRSFFIPPLRVRDSLKREDVVRLLFVLTRRDADGPNAERMWVKVSEVNSTGYVGILGNSPSAIQDLGPGELIAFEPRHVISVLDETWDKYANLTAFVNRRLLENDQLEPHLVVHDPADLQLSSRHDGTRPSGWQLLVGDETEAELSDVANVRTPNLGWLMERYPAFAKLVLSGASDGSWCLSEDQARYEPE